ncbi:MAG: hypothetical protein ACI8QC_000285 [Planctomycetota bacterium]|jgi:hypothetical protein
MRGALHTILFAGLVVWTMCAPCAWILRDGLGPDSVESKGWHALEQFYWTFYWGPVALSLAAAACIWTWASRKPQKQASVDVE